MMKNMRKLYLIFLLPAFWLISCNDFLDVSADNELLQNEIYGDYKGVRMAVNGVYRNLSSMDLYGQNLTWGFRKCYSGTIINPTELHIYLNGLYEAAAFNWESADAQQLCREDMVQGL